MIYIVDGSVVYELTRSQYKKLLRSVADGGTPNVGKYGKQLGHLTSITGVGKTEAQDLIVKMGSM